MLLSDTHHVDDRRFTLQGDVMFQTAYGVLILIAPETHRRMKPHF